MKKITIDSSLCFWNDDTVLPGVNKVAELVKEDIQLVTGSLPGDYVSGNSLKNVVIYGTIGYSKLLDNLDEQGFISLSTIRNKWEVYSFTVVENPFPGIQNSLIIAGSDKRGTIYGLFHLSELIGVSPLIHWNHVWPQKKEQIVLDSSCNYTSNEPSVKYRGFFINDEWPAFGTWASEHFGGINAKCYEGIFELLLRLKGNYLWPAMWNSNFNMDGPGIESARLADELGVVMSTSHHEPCMRAGGEYGLLRGTDSVYGDAWDFTANPEGITNFWRDGLLRNRAYENVITMGMRGENDTAIMANATLADNIRLLRNVLRVQNKLIRETINEDLSKVPRQIVLFTEVEEFFYGSSDVEGLMNDPELDGVTLILSDNNQGSTRTLPTEDIRSHKGGYGMYYHMDMHGGPHSFQWTGSTYLPKVWEQMTMAYEYGVKEIWVTNIGDIGTQEHGLSYFLDLAYDINKWGGNDITVTDRYTKEWIEKQFRNSYEPGEMAQLKDVYIDHLKLLARRKHEVMNDKVYHPVHYKEAEDVLTRSERIMDVCGKLKEKCPTDMLAAYISLVYYPLCGTANLMKMWILAGRNALYAKQNRVETNLLADELLICFEKDEKLTTEYHTVDHGYFNGFGLSEHIGFRAWNDEDNQYPLRTYIYPANHPRMVASRVDDEEYMTGLPWTGRQQVWRNGLRPDVSDITFEIANAGREPIDYRIETDCKWISFSKMSGKVNIKDQICLHLNRELFHGMVTGSFQIIHEGYGIAKVTVEADNCETFQKGIFYENDGYVCMEASHFQRKKDTSIGGFKILEPYGRTGSGIKAFPVTVDYMKEKERPSTEYLFHVSSSGQYIVRFYMAATTPVRYESRQYIGFSINDGAIVIVNTVKEEDKQFFLSNQWVQEAHDNIKLTEAVIILKEGLNSLRFIAMSPAIVLERIVLYRKDTILPESYLGPKESWISR